MRYRVREPTGIGEHETALDVRDDRPGEDQDVGPLPYVDIHPRTRTSGRTADENLMCAFDLVS